MEENHSSITALISAFSRAYHAEHDAEPIFVDALARQLMTDEEFSRIAAYMASGLDFFAPEKKAELADPALARARYCEEKLANAAPLARARLCCSSRRAG